MRCQTSNTLFASVAPLKEGGTTIAQFFLPSCNAEKTFFESVDRHSMAVVQDCDAAVGWTIEFCARHSDVCSVRVVRILNKLSQRCRIPAHEKFTKLAKNVGIYGES